MVTKRQCTFKLSGEYADAMAEMVGEGKEFSTFSAAVEAACIEFVTIRAFRNNIGPEITRYFNTPEGKEHLKNLFIIAAMEANKGQ